MNKKLLVKFVYGCMRFYGDICYFPVNVTTLQGEEMPDSSVSINEKLNIEKRNLEKLRTQLQILETQKDEEKQVQKIEPQNVEQENNKQLNKAPIVINPNENIVLTKETGEYDVAVYSIDATQVKITDILQALSASFGKSIIVDEDVDAAYLSSYVNISIQKSPLQDILEVVLGYAGWNLFKRRIPYMLLPCRSSTRILPLNIIGTKVSSFIKRHN